MEEQKNNEETITEEQKNNEETITEEQKTEEVKTTENWLSKEIEENKGQAFDGEKLPALKLEENKITDIEIDFSKPFDKWTAEDGVVKKIVPVTVKGEKFVWWVNIKNPIYSQILQKGEVGINSFKVLQIGTQKNTRYTIVE
jgi:hypothetical protein